MCVASSAAISMQFKILFCSEKLSQLQLSQCTANYQFKLCTKLSPLSGAAQEEFWGYTPLSIPVPVRIWGVKLTHHWNTFLGPKDLWKRSHPRCLKPCILQRHLQSFASNKRVSCADEETDSKDPATAHLKELCKLKWKDSIFRDC